MTFQALLLLAVGLSMDACAVAICKGACYREVNIGLNLKLAVSFGFFQALMPLIGYFLGSSLKSLIESYDHWIAFVLLALIGANMIREAFGEEEKQNDSFSFRTMFMMAIATSIDALAVGVSFAFMEDVRVVPACVLIGCTTFVISFAGAMLGGRIRFLSPKSAGVLGGIVLIGIGVKLLLEGIL